MTRTSIENAIATRNYSEMLNVFKTHGVDKKFISFFEQNENNPTPLHVNMLTDRVRNILRILDNNKHFEKLENALPAIEVKQTPQKGSKSEEKTRVKILKNPTIDYSLLSDEMKERFDSNTKMHDEMKSIHAALKTADTDERRAELRKMLDEYDTAIGENWEVLDDWYEINVNGNGNANQDDVSEVAKKINAAQRYIQRFDVKKATEKQNAKLKENIEFLKSVGAKVPELKIDTEESIGEEEKINTEPENKEEVENENSQDPEEKNTPTDNMEEVETENLQYSENVNPATEETKVASE